MGWQDDKTTLAQTSVLNTNPNGIPPSTFLGDGSGVSFWNSGAAPAGVSSGYIYLISANGPFDTNLVNGFPRSGSYGDSMLKLFTGGGLHVVDYFTPYNQALNLALELYSSATNPSRDAFGAGNKFIVPTVAGGKVFVGSTHSVGCSDCFTPCSRRT